MGVFAVIKNSEHEHTKQKRFTRCKKCKQRLNKRTGLCTHDPTHNKGLPVVVIKGRRLGRGNYKKWRTGMIAGVDENGKYKVKFGHGTKVLRNNNDIVHRSKVPLFQQSKLISRR